MCCTVLSCPMLAKELVAAFCLPFSLWYQHHMSFTSVHLRSWKRSFSSLSYYVYNKSILHTGSSVGRHRKRVQSPRCQCRALCTKPPVDSCRDDTSREAGDTRIREEDKKNSGTTLHSSTKGSSQLAPPVKAREVRRPQPGPSPAADDSTKRQPKPPHIVAMEELAALESKLAARAAPGKEISAIVAEGGAAKKQRTAEQVAMEEFAALELRIGSRAAGVTGQAEQTSPKRKSRRSLLTREKPKVYWYVSVGFLFC